MYSQKEGKWRKRKKFSWIFNVEAPRKFNSPSIVIFQSVVDEKLTELAIAFDNACDNEKKIFIAYGGNSKILPTYQDKVKFAKSKFWEAHNLAQNLGFTVRKSYRLYLPYI